MFFPLSLVEKTGGIEEISGFPHIRLLAKDGNVCNGFGTLLLVRDTVLEKMRRTMGE
jgi:hypothetical protein